jgi:hypothetical protein
MSANRSLKLSLAACFALFTLSGCSSFKSESSDDPSLNRRTWTHPSGLSNSISFTGTGSGSSSVALDKNGNAILSWEQSDGAKVRLYKSIYRNSIWTSPASLASAINPLEDVTGSTSAISSKGDMVITWTQTNVTSEIYKSEYRGGSWRHPSSAADFISVGGQSAQNPKLAIDNSGNTIIVWQQSDGTNSQIYKSEYRNGLWSHPIGLADNISPDGQNATDPQVAMNNYGNAMIVWSQSDGANTQIFRSEYRNGSWTHPADLTDNISPDGEDASDVILDMNDNSNVLIVWKQSDGTHEQIFKAESRGGIWTYPTSLSDNISPDGSDVQTAAVAINDNSQFLIAWSQSDLTKDRIFKSEYRSGGWTHPASLSDGISPGGQDAKEPVVGMDRNGNCLIVWYGSDGAKDQVFKSQYHGGVWTHPSSLTDNISPDGESVHSLQMAMSANGSAIVTWSQDDGPLLKVYKSEYR